MRIFDYQVRVDSKSLGAICLINLRYNSLLFVHIFDTVKVAITDISDWVNLLINIFDLILEELGCYLFRL